MSNLLVDLCIPPALATLILDTRVDENWIPAIVEFERRLDTLKLRVRVKAARDLSEVAEGLRLVVRRIVYRQAFCVRPDLAGCNEAPHVLLVHAGANTNKYDYESADDPVICMDEVQTIVRLPTTSCYERCE